MSKQIINRVRITCVSGPWLDGECVRFIDMPSTANLYDLHVAIQDAVGFDEEFPFYFYMALSPEGSKALLPEGLEKDVDPQDLDPDVYEDVPVFDHVKPNGKKSLFYIFTSEYDDWVFKVQHTSESHEAVKGEFYPLVLDEMGVGPNPEQYGNGFDDFAETDDEFHPRTRFANEADYNPDDEKEEEDGLFGFSDDDDEDEEEEVGEEDEEKDEW